MPLPRRLAGFAVVCVLTSNAFFTRVTAQTPLTTPSSTSNLKIVIIAGEDSVNIIQQKTAVAPIVEVRDRNDQPVAGAIVTFTMSGGKATFAGGAQTLTMATDAAGRAAVSGISPVSSGSVQINVSASFQGQVATTSISQTNFATTQAAQSAGGSGSSAAGGAAAGGAGAAGGISGGVLAGIVGGVAAAGLVVAKAAGGSSSGGGSTNAVSATGTTTPPTSPAPPPAPTPSAPVTYSGTFSTPAPVSWEYRAISPLITCSVPQTVSGTVRMTLQTLPGGAVTGTMDAPSTTTSGTLTCNFPGFTAPPGGIGTPSASSVTGPVTGTTSSIAFALDNSTSDAGGTTTNRYTFSGALNNGVITGTMVWTLQFNYPSSSGAVGGGGFSVPVTLR